MPTFALALPMIAVAVGFAVDQMGSASLRAKLQAAADAAVLAAAGDLCVAQPLQAAIGETAISVALNQMGASGVPKATISAADIRPTVSTTALTVTLNISVPFVGLYARVSGTAPTSIAVKASAVVKGAVPICLMGTDAGIPLLGLYVDASSRVEAGSCGVVSNAQPSGTQPGIKVDGVLNAARICTTSGYGGSLLNFLNRPPVFCPKQPDPLAGRAPSVGGTGCPLIGMPKIVSGNVTLTEGTYCNGIIVNAGATLTLQPSSTGVFNIRNGGIWVKGGGTLKGDNVTLHFTADALNLFSFMADPGSTVSLSAPKTGTTAGYLFLDNPKSIFSGIVSINTPGATRLLGTIYLPKGVVNVGAAGAVAAQSAYTVLIAQKVFITKGATLFLNSNYAATDVPLPNGFAPLAGQAVLTN